MSTTSSSRTLRLLAGTVAVWLPAALLVVLRQRWHDQLPARIATHWSGTGLPDGYSGAWSSWLVCLVLSIVAGLVAIGAALAHDRSPGFARAVIVACATLAGIAAFSWLISAAATLAAGSAASAELGWRIALIAIPFALGLGVWALLGRTPLRPRVHPSHQPQMQLAPGEQAAWSQSLHSSMFLGLAIALLIAGGVQLAFGLLPSGTLIAVAAVVVAAFASIRCTADVRGLRVCLLGRVPIKRIRLDRMASVSAETIDPLQWGGWGYRVMPGRSALVLRSGPGLVVQTTDGHTFAVTLPDPKTPAALLNALRARVHA